jgi:glycosyltransferase involved in cell wall biosynthesis
MKDSILLSVIVTTHAKAEHFNELLEKILGFKSSRFEIIVINDGADVVTQQFIERAAKKSDNDRVYIFDHEEPAGRGSSLNEALVHASGSLIWAPLRADRLNESLLNEALRRFKADPAAFWVLDYTLPTNTQDWITAAEEGDLPDDSCIVWNKNVIQQEQFFFNPFLDRLHGAELAYRLRESNVWYKTDPFFVVADDQSPRASQYDIQELLFTSFRFQKDEETKKWALDELSDLGSREQRQISDDEFLLQARQLLRQGDAKRSLEMIEKFLKRNPDHHEGLRIKVTVLEKLRRHVEAAELKYNLQKKPKPAEEQVELELIPEQKNEEPVPDEDVDIEVSVVIPTTGHGKSLLERALIYLEKAADPLRTELIVIDNASIDDTFDYLEQLKENGFLNIRIITNPTNKGFAASVNQGLDAAEGEAVLVMHNDVTLKPDTIRLLRKALSHSDRVAVSAPLLSETSVKAQSKRLETEESILKSDRIDSCCFMLKSDVNLRFDEDYRLCFFEIEDFCRQIKKGGKELVVVRDTHVDHKPGSTLSMLGLQLSPDLKWRNRALFYQKWGNKKTFEVPGGNSHPERFLKLGAPDNPIDPDQAWVDTVKEYLTNEVKTEITRGSWSEDELLTIVLTLLIADERELLRTMEDRLENVNPDRSLLMLFVYFYFQKNIFSRCRHYIEMDESGDPIFDLFRLKMLVADKEFEEAVPLLNKLLDQFPTNPELFHLAAEMYDKSGETGEAKSFFAMANQLDPYRFPSKNEAFDIRL